MILTAILAALSLAPTDQQHPDEWNCAEVPDVEAATLCARQRLNESSVGISREYDAMLKVVAEIDERGLPAGLEAASSAAEDFEQAHVAWIVYRNANCYFEGRLSQEALRIPMTVMMCRARMNWDKADQYRYYLIMAR